ARRDQQQDQRREHQHRQRARLDQHPQPRSPGIRRAREGPQAPRGGPQADLAHPRRAVGGAGARVSPMPATSGVVICFNEEDDIAACLESLAWCDEIVVVDSHSTDRTREIALRYTDKVIEQPFLGYVKQKNFALECASHDWVVSLDADEALTP